jgi:hypothetical protein
MSSNPHRLVRRHFHDLGYCEEAENEVDQLTVS